MIDGMICEIIGSSQSSFQGPVVEFKRTYTVDIFIVE